MENEADRQISQNGKTLEQSQKRLHAIIMRGAHDDGSHGLKCLMGLRPGGNPNPTMPGGSGQGTRAGRDHGRHEAGQGTFGRTRDPGLSAKTPYSVDFAYPASALLRIVSSIKALGVTPRKSAVVTRSLTDHPTLPHIFMDIALLVMPRASPSAFCVFPLSPR